MRRHYLLLILVFMPFFSVAVPGDRSVREVLLLHSYNRGLSWTDAIDRSIRSVMAKSDFPLVLTTEFMDTKNHNTRTYYTMLEQMYRYKYGIRKFSLVICSDNNALNFLVERGERLFPGVPVVFCGINDFSPVLLKGKSGFTGIVEEIQIGKTLDLAYRLHPGVTNVYVFADSSPTYLINKRLILNLLRGNSFRWTPHFIDDVPLEKMKSILDSIPVKSIIFMPGQKRDRSGRLLSFREYISFLRRCSEVPIYSLWEYHLGYGIVGGRLVSGREQGRIAAGIGLRILKGVPVSAIPVVLESPNRFMFDERELRRFGISPDRLPVGSIIINRKISVLEKHREILVPVFMVFLVTLFFIVILAFSSHKRKIAEQELRNQKDLLDHFFSLTPVGAVILGKDDGLRFANQEFTRITGYNFGDVNTPVKWFNTLYPDPEYREEVTGLWLEDKKKPQGHRQIRIRCKDGSKKTTEFHVAFLRDGVSLVMIVDVTDRIAAENALRRSLEEKEVLLKEIHHRVKNNLQIVSSILNMQIGKTEDKAALTALEESRQRVQSMAMIHEELYLSKDLAGIDLSRYLPRLTSFIFSTLTTSGGVRHEEDIDSVVLPIEKAIPCGFIVNEALTNAVKHGLPAIGGVVRLEVKAEDGSVLLRISDTGPGFPEGFDPEEGNTLGMQLISVLTRQLRGDLHWKNDNGAVVEVSFPVDG